MSMYDTVEEGVPGLRPDHFDIFNQTFEIIGPDGSTQTLSTLDIELVKLTAVRTAIIFATQLGASAILLLVLLLMTPGAKRRSLSWIFNVLALVCNVTRCTMQCLEMTGPFLNFVLIVTQEYGIASLNRHIRLAIANNVVTTMVFIFIELALVTQVQVICAAAVSSLYRIGILTFCGVVATVAIGFRLNLMIANSVSTASLGRPSTKDLELFERLDWAQSANNVTAIVSICVFSAVFCTKLGLAIRSRRSMGLKQFGAMQIVFIMGCQTLTIPGKLPGCLSRC
jgi:pheromone alpha factor receptor